MLGPMDHVDAIHDNFSPAWGRGVRAGGREHVYTVYFFAIQSPMYFLRDTLFCALVQAPPIPALVEQSPSRWSVGVFFCGKPFSASAPDFCSVQAVAHRGNLLVSLTCTLRRRIQSESDSFVEFAEGPLYH